MYLPSRVCNILLSTSLREVTSHLIQYNTPKPFLKSHSLCFHSSLDPDGVASFWSARLHCQFPKSREKLLHFLLQHIIPLLCILLRPLCITHFDFYHCELLPLLIQLFMQGHHFCLQGEIFLLQAA